MIKPTGIVSHYGKSGEVWCNKEILYIIGKMDFLSWEMGEKLSQKKVLQWMAIICFN